MDLSTPSGLQAACAEFARRHDRVLQRCARRGVVLRVYCTDRSPREQAALWRRSRATSKIRAAADRLRASGAPWLAQLLLDVGPQHGRWATNALPGLSWHQWSSVSGYALARDAYVVDDDDLDGDGSTTDALWSTSSRDPDADANGYAVYREEGLAEGLAIATINDWPHLQLPLQGSPLSAGLTWPQIDQAMRHRWA